MLRWHCALKLALLTSGSVIWAAADLTLTIDCAFCGPGQPFPHECPKASSAAAALSTAEAFSNLVGTARKEARRLHAISGMSIPELGEVGSLAQLDTALTNLIAETEAEIARCERETADFLRKSTTAGAEITRLDQLAGQLAEEIEHARSAVIAAESNIAAEIRAATAARDETAALQKSINQIRSEIRQVRNRLFPRLHQAAHVGWILPPSSYRPLPTPLPPTARLAGYAVDDVSPARSPESGRMTSGQLDATPVSLAGAPLLELPGRSDVQARLEQLPALWERARAAAARRDDAIRSLDQQRSQTDAQSARLSVLEPQRTAAATQLAVARRNITLARQMNAEYSARLSAARATAVHAWIEWGIFDLLEKKAAGLLAHADARATEATFLDAWRDVAATAVQLGSDPLGVIAKFPTAVTTRGETLDDLRRALADVREKFGVGFAASISDLPPTALPYITKDGL
jgi:hypothetical protein